MPGIRDSAFRYYKRSKDGRLRWSSPPGRTHPNRIPRSCTLLAQVARTITASDARNDRTARNTVELALHLDRPGNTCLEAVLAALPDTETVRADRRDWDSFCLPSIRKCRRLFDRDYLH